MAEDRRAKRSMLWLFPLCNQILRGQVLEIGSYSGYSALAWYEGTRATEAEIITLELSPQMIAATRRTLDMYNLNDRVTLIEGLAQHSYVASSFTHAYVTTAIFSHLQKGLKSSPEHSTSFSLMPTKTVTWVM